MVRVVNVQRQQLEHRRAEILARHGVTLDEFAERAVRYALVGDEWDAWGSCAASPSCSAMPEDSVDGTESSFRVQFIRFAEEIRQLVTAVFGGELDMAVTHLASRSRIFAEVPLTVAGENLARLKIDVWCCLDSYQQFLAVTELTYQLIAQVDRAPIMRFEYERGATSKLRAHLQVHAHRGALSHLLSQARHPTPHSMESLHLPVGGDRFRPCPEDVIEFLVVECRFDCREGWRGLFGSRRYSRIRVRRLAGTGIGTADRAGIYSNHSR